jgi:hypothetical protein
MRSFSFGQVPWLLDILWYCAPGQDVQAFETLAHKMVTRRCMEIPREPNDLCSHLVRRPVVCHLLQANIASARRGRRT